MGNIYDPADGSGKSAVRVVNLDDTAIGSSSSGVQQGTLTDRSNADIDAASEQVMAANTARRYLFLMAHPSNTGVVWFDFTATAVATQPSIPLNAGDIFEMSGSFVSTEAINAIGSAANQVLIAREG